MSDTAFTHELLHCYFFETRVTHSFDHSEPEWDLVPEINAWLSENDL